VVPHNDVARMGTDILSTLEYIHSQNAAHFTVELDNSCGQYDYHHWPPIVCDSSSCPATLLVTGLKEPIHSWNLEHPTKAVEVGQLILSINGIEGDSVKLRNELKTAKKLVLKLRAPSMLHSNINSKSVIISADGAVKLTLPRNNNMVKLQGRADEVGEFSLYFSPERSRQDKYDGRDDVWAVGCVMAELLAGKTLDQLADEVPVPMHGCWEPLGCSEVYLLGEFKMWLQTVFKVNKKVRPQATAARVGLMAVPPSHDLLGIKVVGAQNLPLSNEGACYYCTCGIQGAHEKQLRTESLQGQGSVTWDQRMGLAPYKGGPLKFSVWLNSSWMAKLQGSLAWMNNLGVTDMKSKLCGGLLPNAGRDGMSRLLGRESAGGFLSQMHGSLASMREQCDGLGSNFARKDTDRCLGTFELSEVDFTGADQDLHLASGEQAGTVLTGRLEQAGTVTLTVRLVRPSEGNSGANFRKSLEALHQQKAVEGKKKGPEESASDAEDKDTPPCSCAHRVKPCCPIS